MTTHPHTAQGVPVPDRAGETIAAPARSRLPWLATYIRLTRLRAKRSRLVWLWLREGMSWEEYKHRIAILDTRIERLEREFAAG